VANQAVLAQRLAEYEVDGFHRPCADAPLRSRVCREADFGLEHAEWLRRLHEEPVVFRKQWEHTAICRALEAAGALSAGSRGLGFGVGREPLVAAFAALGVDVTATDLDATDSRAAAWSASNQHSLSLAGLSNEAICNGDELRRHVTVRPVDMNHVPEDLVGFDFVWSACAFEHLGSIEAGLAFVERSMRCLRPGGVAAHTTEFNVDGDGATIETGPTVAFRRRDFSTLADRLARQGHHMEPFEVGDRTGVLDNIIDIPPYQYRSLLLRLGDHRITSAVIIAHAGART
jgi:hypothetical protein